MIFKKIAIIGAGVMGGDVAFDLASKGIRVTLLDISEEILNDTKYEMKNKYNLVKMVKKIIKVQDFDSILQNISFTTQYSDIENFDLIIENISEDIQKKRELYTILEKTSTVQPVYAVNTSCISITTIASLVRIPEKVIGMHFMNPVPLKEMVEMIKGFHTSTETIETCKLFLKKLGKTPVIVNDYPGFVANRLSHLFMNEAAFLVQDQVASPKEIDLIFKKGYGHAMGPLETADLIGLDTVLNSLHILYESYQDPKYRCCPLLKKMVAAGNLGRKSGKGFFDY